MSDLKNQIGDYAATDPTDSDFIMFCYNIISEYINSPQEGIKVYRDDDLSYLISEDVKIMHLFYALHNECLILSVGPKTIVILLYVHIALQITERKYGTSLSIESLIGKQFYKIKGYIDAIPHKMRFKMEIRDLFNPANVKSARNR